MKKENQDIILKTILVIQIVVGFLSKVGLVISIMIAGVIAYFYLNRFFNQDLTLNYERLPRLIVVILITIILLFLDKILKRYYRRNIN
ncbi:MAG: hypothetical protein KDE33_07905 [Bacteroidetes bacterium]|nr:hypothetical protein [Bacteroidota bacterium]